MRHTRKNVIGSITFVPFILLFFARPVFGQGEVLTERIQHDGRTREYRLFVPSGYSPDTPTPFVFNLHGLTGNGFSQMNSSQMNAVAEEEGFLVAYPSAIAGNWFTPADQDLGFIDLLLETIQADYNVDESRVYSTGMSQGGIMSYMLGASRSDTFAAIASVTGTRYIESGDQYFPASIPNVPPRPLPMLHVHGTADLIVPFHGGGSIFGVRFPSVDQVVTEWAANNGCESSPTTSELPDIRADNETVTLFSYETCEPYFDEAGTERSAGVLFYRINGGVHRWPDDSNDISASREVWDFFSRHALAVEQGSLLDFDGDGLLSVTDVDMLVTSISSGQPEAVFDLSGDGAVDQTDLDRWLEEAGEQAGYREPYLSGDSNLDGQVDATDLNNLALNWQQEVATWSGGDFMADGIVNSGDLNRLALNWQRSLAVAAAVPEPGSRILWLVGVFVFLAATKSNRLGPGSWSVVLTTRPLASVATTAWYSVK